MNMNTQNVKKFFYLIAFCMTSLAYCAGFVELSIIFFSMMFVFGGLISYSSSFRYTLVCLVAAYFTALTSLNIHASVTGIVCYNIFILFALPVIPGVGCGIAFKKKSDFRSVYTITSFCFLIVMILHLGKMVYFDKINVVDFYIRGPIEFFFSKFKTELEVAGYAGALNEQNIVSFVNTLVYSTPSMLIIASMVIGFFHMYVLKKIIKWLYREEKFENTVAFSHLIMSPGSSAGFSVLFILSMFLSGMPGVVVSNILSVMLIMFYGCGFSLLDFYLKKAIRIVILRVLIYISGFTILASVMPMLIMVNPAMALVFVAILDSTRDFRKIRNNKFTIYIK